MTIDLISALDRSRCFAGSTAPAQDKFENSPDARVLGDFKMRVEKYDQLRKKADDSAPPLERSRATAKIKDAQQGLAERIGAARAGVKQGEIFTPEISAVFKRLLRPEAKDTNQRGAEGRQAGGRVVQGQRPVSRQAAGCRRCRRTSSQALPALPKDIEYRFIEKHLILRDARANLIIDYMLNAIP